MFYLFGLSIAFFLFLLILLKRGKTPGDRILMIWMGVVTLHLLLFNLEYSGIIYRYPHLLGLSLPLPELHGAFLFFYTVRTTRDRFLEPWRVVACLLPFIVMAALALPFYALSAQQKIEVFENRGKGFEWYIFLQSIVVPACGLLFSIASIYQIRKFRKQLLDNFSNSDKKMLRWLEYLAIALGLIWLTVVFFDDDIVFAGVVLFVLLIGIFGINQNPVFYVNSAGSPPSSDKPASTNEVAGLAEVDKYSKSGLKEEDAVRRKRELDDFMETVKPFKNPELTLDALAESLKIPPNQLSQIINSIEGKTFYHYINTFRIKEFLTIAERPENRKFTYLGLAQECGFSSKSTFNKYFKLQTGKTPSDYFSSYHENEPALKD